MALKACDSINPFLYCPVQIAATMSGLRERDFIEILANPKFEDITFYNLSAYHYNLHDIKN